MMNLDDIEIKDFICNEFSSFALSIVDIESSEVIYANKAMQNFMVDTKAKKCHESIYGLNSQCTWCGLKNNLSDSFDFEYFNEKTDKWYQVQNKITKLKDGKSILVAIAIDISIQKEAQGKFITTQVKLVQQTQKLEKAQEELKLLASTDFMTKLYNRRHFFSISKSFLDLAKRNQTSTTIIMLDIDHFKYLNDTYGHKVGDDVIITLASILQEHSRKSDIVSRWGGEEFVILLSTTDIDGAFIIAQKIMTVIQDLVIKLESRQELKFTVSMGLSEVDNNRDINIEASINRADLALYEAKRSGRNKVCVKCITSPEKQTT